MRIRSTSILAFCAPIHTASVTRGAGGSATTHASRFGRLASFVSPCVAIVSACSAPGAAATAGTATGISTSATPTTTVGSQEASTGSGRSPDTASPANHEPKGWFADASPIPRKLHEARKGTIRLLSLEVSQDFADALFVTDAGPVERCSMSAPNGACSPRAAADDPRAKGPLDDRLFPLDDVDFKTVAQKGRRNVGIDTYEPVARVTVERAPGAKTFSIRATDSSGKFGW